MSSFIKRITCLFLCLFLLVPLAPVQAAEDSGQAEDISGTNLVTKSSGFSSTGFLFDGTLTSGNSSDGSASLTLEYAGGIGSLYLIFKLDYGAYTVTDNVSGQSITCGEQGFLHEFIDLETAFGAAPASVTLSFSSGTVKLNELYAFTSGETPDFVQKWQAPADGATDIVLFSTHGDDEQLFFAGLLPYYAKGLGYRVQVVYLTDHRNNTQVRVHEMLNGLWAVGVTAYPVFGEFDDFLLETKEATYAQFAKLGTTKDDIMAFVVEQLRRFKPLVVVGHDFAGEYSHGQHMVYAEVLAEALEISNDPEEYPVSADIYGVWDVPKAYFHLYEENQIVMDWDTPMEELDGMTPFEVTQKLGFPCHESQQWTWFNRWINGKNTAITKASQIETYSPCLFGLYRSTVGEDVEKNDFMENLTNYAELERLEAERLEAERIEQERLEAERLEQERQEAERLEQERLTQESIAAEQAAAEELARQQAEQEALRAEAQRRDTIELIVLLALFAGLLITAIVLIVILLKRRHSARSRYARKKR